jgi:hypothetical protein
MAPPIAPVRIALSADDSAARRLLAWLLAPVGRASAAHHPANDGDGGEDQSFRGSCPQFISE